MKKLCFLLGLLVASFASAQTTITIPARTIMVPITIPEQTITIPASTASGTAPSVTAPPIAVPPVTTAPIAGTFWIYHSGKFKWGGDYSFGSGRVDYATKDPQTGEKVIGKAKTIAAHLLECAESDLDFANGSFTVRGTETSTTIQDVALAVFAAHNLPDGFEPSLDSDATYDPENFSFPHGTHLCATEVDTETGRVRIRSYVCVDDVGKVVNPLIVDGQVHGGLAQGIAQALYEEAVHDEAGTLTTATFADYLLPSAVDLPSFVTDRTETPATTNPLGVKGVGEAGTIASTPAVVNAIVDAVRHLGVSDVEMPCSPQRVWRAIQAASTGGAE